MGTPKSPPRYSSSQIVQIMKSVSAEVVFREFPEVEKQLRRGELWRDGYFVRPVENKLTSKVVRL